MTITKQISLTFTLILSFFQLNAQIEVVNNDKRNAVATVLQETDEYKLYAGLENSMTSFRRLQYQKVDATSSERTSYYIEGPLVNGERSMAHSWSKHGDYIYEVYMISKPKSLLLFQYGILKRDIKTLEQVGELVIIGNDLEDNFFKENIIEISNKGIVSLSYAKTGALLSSFSLDLNPTYSEMISDLSTRSTWTNLENHDDNFFITYSNTRKSDIKGVQKEYTISKEEVNALFIDPLKPSNNLSMNLWLPESLITTWQQYELDFNKKQIVGYFFTHVKGVSLQGVPLKGNAIKTYTWDFAGTVSEVSSVNLDYEAVLGEEGKKYVESKDEKTYSTKKEEFPYVLAAPHLEKGNEGHTLIVFNSLLENSSLYSFINSNENLYGTTNGYDNKEFREVALKNCAYSIKFENGQMISDRFMYPGQKSDLK